MYGALWLSAAKNNNTFVKNITENQEKFHLNVFNISVLTVYVRENKFVTKEIKE